jgi:hypothetical protein
LLSPGYAFAVNPPLGFVAVTQAMGSLHYFLNSAV